MDMDQLSGLYQDQMIVSDSHLLLPSPIDLHPVCVPVRQGCWGVRPLSLGRPGKRALLAAGSLWHPKRQDGGDADADH